MPYDNPLYNVPGLGGYLAQQQMSQAKRAQDMENQVNQMKLSDLFQTIQNRKSLSEALQSQGTNPDNRLNIIMKAAAAGDEHAAALLPIVKEQIAQQKSQQEAQNQQTMNTAREAYQGAQYQDASGKMVPIDQSQVAQNLIGSFGTADEQKKVMENQAIKSNEAPKTREVKSGDKVITQEWVNGAWKNVAIGDQWNTQTTKPMTEAQRIKFNKQIADDFKSTGQVVQTMEEIKNSIKTVIGSKGLSAREGYTGYIPAAFQGKNAMIAENRLNTLKGKVTQMGKAMATMSGAIGPMAVQEWKIVADAVNAIDPKAGNLSEQLGNIEAQAQGAANRIRDSYDAKYTEYFDQKPQFRTENIKIYPSTTFGNQNGEVKTLMGQSKQPPSLKTPPTEADINATAIKYKMTPAQVRAKLGLPPKQR